MLATIFFGLPETLYLRSSQTFPQVEVPTSDRAFNARTYRSRLALWSNHPELNIKANQFVLPAFKVAEKPLFLMMKLSLSRWLDTRVYSSRACTMQRSMGSPASYQQSQ
jgi:hypothetical protein